MRLPQTIPLRSQLRYLLLVLMPAVVGSGAAALVLLLPQLTPPPALRASGPLAPCWSSLW